jgi:hypothetical protein
MTAMSRSLVITLLSWSAAAGCDVVAPVDYATCDDADRFEGNPDCVDGACAASDAVRHFYARMKAHALGLSGMSEADWRERVLVKSIQQDQYNERVRFDYVLALGEFRGRAGYSFQVDAEVTDPAIDIALADPEWADRWITLGTADSIRSPSWIEDVARRCQPDIELEWCDAGHRVSGTNRESVEDGTNECMRAVVDLFTGELVECRPRECFDIS